MSEPKALPSLLDLGEGFLALPRRLCASPFFAALRADERMVFIQMLLAARYAEGGEFWFAGTRIPLAPGQFIDAEETIARASGSTRRTVRTVIQKALTAGLITRARAHPAGQCPTVTTIVDYERICFRCDSTDQRNDQPTGHEATNRPPADRPRSDQPTDPIRTTEQGNPGEPGEPSEVEAEESATAAPPAPPLQLESQQTKKNGKAEKAETVQARAVRESWNRIFREVRGVAYAVATKGAVIADRKAAHQVFAAAAGDLAEIEAKIRAALRNEGFPQIYTLTDVAHHWARFSTVRAARKLVPEPAAPSPPVSVPAAAAYQPVTLPPSLESKIEGYRATLCAPAKGAVKAP